jgi:hypothetical protein
MASITWFDAGGSGGDAHDPIGEARKLREEGDEVAPKACDTELARLAGEREQLRSSAGPLLEFREGSADRRVAAPAARCRAIGRG